MTSARIFVREAPVWLPFALLAFVVASVVMTGWPDGLIPNLSYPYSVSGDGLAVSWVTQNLIEGNWLLRTDRSGYPFGSGLLDYPMSDAGSHAILKLLGWLTGTHWATTNAYFLLGFPVVFAAAYAVFRAMRISPALSTAASMLFTLLPYHFLRLEHLFLTWYFPVPVFFLLAWRLYGWTGEQIRAAVRGRAGIVYIPVLLVLGSFGVYYAIFGIIVLLVGGLGGWIRGRSVMTLATAIAATSLVTVAVGINVAPNLVYMARNGLNPEVASRGPEDSETYGLKLVQMVLPRADHRIAGFGDVTRTYDRLAPLVNENATATLGVVGTAGLLLLGGVVLTRLAGRESDERLAFLALVILCLCAISTIGGVSAIFSMLATPIIRGWNRISVFVAFGAIATAMIALEWLLTRYTSARWLTPMLAVVAFLVATLGALDQTAPACRVCNRAVRDAFERDRSFVTAIEQRLPTGAGMYQMPYMAFPEAPPLNRLHAYDPAAGAIYSNRLRWSYGAIKGREGDLYLRALGMQPIAAQLDVLRRLRFSGIYLDRRGYQDGGRAVEEALRQSLGTGPALVRSDGQVAFYTVEPVSPGLPAGLSIAQITDLAGFALDKCGARQAATPYEGIDLRKQELPEFVREVRGLSGVEEWGRWSDANLSRSVVIEFRNPLPRSFTLVMRGDAFGPNAGQPVLVKVGHVSASVKLSDRMEEKRVRFDLDGNMECKLEIVPPVPISPASMHLGDDARALGVGLESVRIER